MQPHILDAKQLDRAVQPKNWGGIMQKIAPTVIFNIVKQKETLGGDLPEPDPWSQI